VLSAKLLIILIFKFSVVFIMFFVHFTAALVCILYLLFTAMFLDVLLIYF